MRDPRHPALDPRPPPRDRPLRATSSESLLGSCSHSIKFYSCSKLTISLMDGVVFGTVRLYMKYSRSAGRRTSATAVRIDFVICKFLVLRCSCDLLAGGGLSGLLFLCPSGLRVVALFLHFLGFDSEVCRMWSFYICVGV